MRYCVIFAIGAILGLFIACECTAQIVRQSTTPVEVLTLPKGSTTVSNHCVLLPEESKAERHRAAVVRFSGLEGFVLTTEARDREQNLMVVSEIEPGAYLVSGAPVIWLRLTAIDFDNRRVETVLEKVEVGEEPEPEPDEDESEGDQELDSNPLHAKAIVFVEETKDRGKFPDQTTAMLDVQLWQSLKDMGLEIHVVDDDEPDSRWQRVVDFAGGVRPAMVIVESAEKVRAFPVPTTSAEIESTIRGNIVR